MKKLLTIFFVLLLCACAQAQTIHTVPVYANYSYLRDSLLANGKHTLRIKSDSLIETWGYVKFIRQIVGDVDITGNFKINGVTLSSGTRPDTTIIFYKADTLRLYSIYNLDTTKTPKLTMNNTLTGINYFNRKIGTDTITTSTNGGTPSDLEITAADSVRVNSHVKLNGKSLSLDGSLKTNISVLSNSKLMFKSGSNDTLGTADDYSLLLKTSDSTRLTISNRGDLTLPDTTYNTSYGTIYKGATRFINTFHSDSSAGFNTFVGMNSGNFTMNVAGQVMPTFNFYASYNTGLGYNSLKSLTTGYYNCAFGYNAGGLITTGALNFPMGAFAMNQVTTGSHNVTVGGETMVYGNGSGNLWMGSRSGYGTSGQSNSYNVGIGMRSAFYISTGSYNTFIGSNAGETNTTGANNIFIGKYGNNSGGALWGRTTTGSFNTLIGDTLKVFNTNGALGLSNDSTASRHLNIARLFFARDTYTDTMKAGIGIRDDSVTARWHIKAGSTQRHTAPLKFNTGSLLTTPEVGAVEFLTDDLFFTQTTNTSRNRIAINRSDTLSTYAATVSVTMQGSLKQVTVTGNCTLNATGGAAGSTITFYMNNTGGSTYTITFGTNIKSMGTVSLSNTAGTNEATATFVCLDGTNWVETSRAVGM